MGEGKVGYLDGDDDGTSRQVYTQTRYEEGIGLGGFDSKEVSRQSLGVPVKEKSSQIIKYWREGFSLVFICVQVERHTLFTGVPMLKERTRYKGVPGERLKRGPSVLSTPRLSLPRVCDPSVRAI